VTTNRISCRGTAGFTMVELLLCLTVLLVLAAVALPRLPRLGSVPLTGAARIAAADLAWAQARAIATGTTTQVVFSAASDSYQIKADGTALSLPRSDSGSTSEDFSSVARGATIEIVSDTTVSFNRLGEPAAGATVTLRCGDQTQAISVNAVTGRVTVP